MKIDRRAFIRSLAAGSGGALLTKALHPLAASGAAPPPPIKHVVVVCMENRSFDHLLGWLPNANGLSGATSNTLYSDLHPLVTNSRQDFTGCGHPNPDHSYTGGRIEYNNGNMNGFLLDQNNDLYCLGYYQEADRPFFSSLARNFTSIDCYFCSLLGPTFPNRLFLHAGQTDRLADTLQLSSLPTIWDSLAAAGISRRYYFNNYSFLSLWGLKYAGISASYGQFLWDAANNRLPAVAFIDPRFDGYFNLGNDDEPHADVRAGDKFLAQVFSALSTSKAWPSTVLIITYDEWGGFFDHVVPPRVAAPNNVDPDLVNGKALLGFRVPCIIASPWSVGDPANPRVIQNQVFDHTSILKLIESRWNLQPITATTRDGSTDIANLMTALDLANYNPQVPGGISTPASPQLVPCVG